MKSTTENLSPTRVKLTIEVPFDEFKPALDKAYKSIGSQIQVPGFRRGKVPAAVVDQRVGRGVVLDEAINAALPDWYREALLETDLQPLGQPEIDLTKFADGEDIEITAEVDVRPEVELPDLTSVEVEVTAIEVGDSDVDEQLEALRERFATYTGVERAAAKGDQVTLSLAAAHKDGTVIEDATAEDLPYRVGGSEMLDGLDEAVTGLEPGSTATFATTLVGGELKDTEVDVTVTVTEVKQTELPELDEEFVQMASEFDTLEELRADLRERITRGKRMEQAAEARDLVLDELLSKVEVPLPETLVAEELAARRQQIEQQLAFSGVAFEQYLDDQEQTADEFEAELEKSVHDSIVSQFILDQIVKADEIGLDDNELTQHIMRRAQQSGEDPNSYIQHIMEHNHVPEMVSEVLRGKALASLVEGATVKDSTGAEIDLASLQADGSLKSETAEDDASDQD
ncbi:MAG: trigger factor [Aeromicrobium sp.]|uniref:trigger factor n=1 Tax=Aeromicrobium sp. TaxID=1871063 RepID=UPI002638D3A8|nr:trigger factor [Aeromicrobium sp.]MDF1703744.1 trigger factor [Aeromicrobium sp.]